MRYFKFSIDRHTVKAKHFGRINFGENIFGKNLGRFFTEFRSFLQIFRTTRKLSISTYFCVFHIKKIAKDLLHL